MDSPVDDCENARAMMPVGFNAGSRFVFAALAFALASGCAWVPQKVAIKPGVQIAPSDAGGGTTVAVRVVDLRSSSIVGYRGMDSNLAKITVGEDLPAVIQREVIAGLRQKGFEPVTYPASATRQLKVEIRLLEYTSEMDFWKGTIRVRAALGAYAKTNERIFDQVFSADMEEHAVEAPGAKTNARLINGAIAEALHRLLEDRNLLRFLAG